MTEKEPIQALKEVDVLAKLTPRMECLADLGPVTEPSMTQQLCKAFPGGCHTQTEYSRIGECLSSCKLSVTHVWHT